MKKIKLILLSLLLAVVIMPSSLIDASENNKEVKLLCYNVAGLPFPNEDKLKGNQGFCTSTNQLQIGKQINSINTDIVFVQEDFTYHNNLIKGLTNYKYRTNHTGGIPGGDGLNIYSKYPIYNEKRTTWRKLSGVLSGLSDELTPKGVVFSCIDLGDGYYLDVYDLHMDAGDDLGSVEARNDNIRQVAQIIKSRNSDNPIIITGDFNTSSHSKENSGDIFNSELIRGLGFKDAWTEQEHNGDYENWSELINKYAKEGIGSYGNWDSMEKFLYKDGKDVSISLKNGTFEYKDLRYNGKSLSDHKAAYGEFVLTKMGNSVTQGSLKVTPKNVLKTAVIHVSYIVSDVKKIFNEIGGLFK